MILNKREEIQLAASEAIYNAKFSGILDLSPRVGKSKAALMAFEKLTKPINILISAPFNSILSSWEEEILKWGSKHYIKLINNRSLSTIDFKEVDCVILDECHASSQLQRSILREAKKPIIGLTGSLGEDSRKELKLELGIKPIYTYSIIQAINDNIIADFKINIHYVELDNKIKNVNYGNKKFPLLGTELEAYNYASAMFEKMKYASWSNPALASVKMKFAGERSRIIYNSINKIKLTQKLCANNKKTLIFTALTKVADQVCEHSYHSKSNENNLELFINGSINKLSVVNQVSMGVTIPNLKHIVINQLQSSEEMGIQRIMRAMNFENSKSAVIDIIVVKDKIDQEWVNKALSWVNESKINYK